MHNNTFYVFCTMWRYWTDAKGFSNAPFDAWNTESHPQLRPFADGQFTFFLVGPQIHPEMCFWVWAGGLDRYAISWLFCETHLLSCWAWHIRARIRWRRRTSWWKPCGAERMPEPRRTFLQSRRGWGGGWVGVRGSGVDEKERQERLIISIVSLRQSRNVARLSSWAQKDLNRWGPSLIQAAWIMQILCVTSFETWNTMYRKKTVCFLPRHRWDVFHG